MSFWEDSSPIVKGAVVIGVVGLLYFVVAWGLGLPPMGGGHCTHTPEGASEAVEGCPDGSACTDGECVNTTRGFQR